MTQALSDEDVRTALDGCASEPAHTPGTVQPLGVLLGVDMASGAVQYASANAGDLFGGTVDRIFGCHLRDLMGSKIWHGVLNLTTLSAFAERRYYVGTWHRDDQDYAVHISKGGDCYVIEIEDPTERPETTPDMLREQTLLINQIQACPDEAALFELTTRLLRHVTGFDRVMIYKFDPDWHGEVLAEAKNPALDPFIGLRFPHWDIPEQARAIMARIQLRLICDVEQTPVPIIAASDALPPLNMALAQLRGVSTVHMQYLRNMGTGATMTLSVVLDGVLWGMISFHHRRPKITPSAIRQILTAGFLPVFCLKLGLLRDRATLALSRRLDALQTDIQTELERGSDVPDLLDSVGQTFCDALEVDGLVIATGAQTYVYGERLGPAVLDRIFKMAHAAPGEFVAIDSLEQALPDLAGQFGNLAGALATARSEGRCLVLLRREALATVAWAGSPNKTIETVDGNMRLQPRGSFSRYMEDIRGTCKAWTDQDRLLARQLWPLLSATKRQALMADLSRQQELMIGELNHRVRNILALVKSVSQRARKSQGSLESYSQALEARIMALAAAHDIGAGAAVSAVSVRRMLALEIEPFGTESEQRFLLTGDDIKIRADVAPIFALVIHELMTNAVKYGALSDATGRIAIDLQTNGDGMTLSWVETGGPAVVEPEAFGFGTALIREAVPFEMNGSSEIEFAADGLRATLGVPSSMLDLSSSPTAAVEPPVEMAPVRIPEPLTAGPVLVLEDNFIIASDLAADLESMGFLRVEICGDAENALEFLKSGSPRFALLDVNLGPGQTSEAVATALQRRGIPFTFVTGYGDKLPLPPHLSEVPTLTKPATVDSIRTCIAHLVGAQRRPSDGPRH